MASTVIPFDSGQHQGIDRRMLPNGRFALVQNGRLSRDGQIRARPAYTALAATVFGAGTFVAYDLFSYNDRLVALGDSGANGFPTDVFELVEGGGAVWRASAPGATGFRLPRATEVRDMAQPPDQQSGVNNFGCAALGGFVALTFNNNVAGSDLGFVHVCKANTGQSVLFAALPSAADAPTRATRVVALSDRFIIVGLNQDEDQVGAYSFRPAVDEDLVALSSNLGGQLAADKFALAVAAVANTVIAQFVVVTLEDAGTVRIRRYDNAGTLQVPSGGQYADTGALFATMAAVEADAISNTITVAIVGAGGGVAMHTYNLSTGAQIGAGPFDPFGADIAVEIGLCRISASQLHVLGSVTNTTEPSVRIRPYTPSTNAFGTQLTVSNCKLASSPLFSSGKTVFAVRFGGTPSSQANALIETAAGGNDLTPLIVKDLDVSTAQSLSLPDLVRDATSGYFYWANAVLSADGDASPRVTEFALNSAKRRQMARVGNLVAIAGGLPCVWDGTQLAELGFLTRPRIVSVTGNTGGGLIVGGTYRYKQIWEVLDTIDNVWRSATSDITSVTQDTGDTLNTLVSEAPPSLRLNASAASQGSVVRVKTYRTVATLEETPAIVTGRAGVDPPSASLVGRSLRVYIDDATGETFFTITFTAAATTGAAIASEINAVTAGRITATVDGGALVLTSSDEGEDVSIWIYGGGTGHAILGFFSNQNSVGTSRHRTGATFQLTSTTYTTLGAAVGAYVNVTDSRSDTSLREQQILYTGVESPLEHFACPPAEVLAFGRDIVVAAKQPRRDRWAVSKQLAPSQGIQFANPGLFAFTGRVPGDIEAAAVRGGSMVFWTRQQIWSVAGEGPQRTGQGAFSKPQRIYDQGGMRIDGWQSLVTFDGGTAFQLADSKIYLMAPSGEMQWIGFDVIDTLETYPIVKAACHVQKQNALVFACQNAAGNDGVLLIYDLRRKVWLQDPVGAVSAVADYQGRIAFALGGIVFLEDTAAGVGAYPTLTVRLGSFTGWGPGGCGALEDIMLLARWRGDCSVQLRISLDEITWKTLGTKSLVTAVYDPDQPIEEQFTPHDMENNRFALEVIVTGGSNTEGIWLNALELFTDRDPGPARLPGSKSR